MRSAIIAASLFMYSFFSGHGRRMHTATSKSQSTYAGSLAEKIEFASADIDVQEQAMRLAKQIEASLTDSKVQEHTERITEHLKTMMTDPGVQTHAKRIAKQLGAASKHDLWKVFDEQMEETMSDPDVQKLSHELDDQIKMLVTDPHILEQARHIAGSSISSASDSSKPLATLLLASNPSMAFNPPGTRRLHRSRSRGSRSVAASPSVTMSALDPIKGPLQSYADIWIPGFKWAAEAGIAPDFLIHWGHPAAMAIVLLTMGNFGAYLGWQTRLGNGGEQNALSLGETFRELHPKIMAGALFFFFLGGQGGLVLTAVQGKPILESTHATTAFLGLGLLVIQALLPTLFSKTDLARDAHAYLGTATMAVLFAHMAAGLNLGFSI